MDNSIGEILRQTLDRQHKHEALEKLLPDYMIESSIEYNEVLETNTLRCNVYDRSGEYCCPVTFLLDKEIDMGVVCGHIQEAFRSKGDKSPLPTSP